MVAPLILIVLGGLAWLASRSLASAVAQLAIGLALVAVITVMSALRIAWPDVDPLILVLNPYFVATAALVLTAAGGIGAAVHAGRRLARRGQRPA